MRSHLFYLLLIGLLAASPALFAANVNVGVGGTMNAGGYYGGTTPVLAFSPGLVTINVGDSITFTSAGGARHNVHADDDSFMCSDGCRGDGTGATGAPSLNDWSAKVTFSKPGTFGFHCDEHQSMGMVGTVTVKAVTPTIALGGYLSGNWYNSAQGGHGFQLELTNTVNPTTGKPNMLAIWFVYSPDGTAQNWIYSQGDYDPTSNAVTLPAIMLTGPKFPPAFNSADLHQTPWGTLTFTFSDCNTGMASWAPTMASYTAGSLPITRLTQIAGTSCPQ